MVSKPKIFWVASLVPLLVVFLGWTDTSVREYNLMVLMLMFLLRRLRILLVLMERNRGRLHFGLRSMGIIHNLSLGSMGMVKPQVLTALINSGDCAISRTVVIPNF